MAEGKAFMLDKNSQRDVEEFSAERESSRLNMASRLGLTRRERGAQEAERGEGPWWVQGRGVEVGGVGRDRLG